VSQWGTTESNRRARYYRLTAAGRKQLVQEEAKWMKLTNAVAQVLNFAASKA
jgi:PadR family transcriptional regulator, regulatory protein PadR